MKLKRMILCLAATILCGCTTSVSDLPSVIKANMDTVLQQDAGKANRSKTYYAYYIEPSVGRLSGNQTGNIFLYEGTRILMNLNVSGIVNEENYPNSTADGMDTIPDPLIDLEGEYHDASRVTRKYHLFIYQEGNAYLTMLHTSAMTFAAISDPLKAAEIAPEMLKIARTVEVNTDEVITAYTNQKILDFKTEKIDLYNEIVPESGNINELINETNTIGDTNPQSTSAAAK
jgi:hypothetical protein